MIKYVFFDWGYTLVSRFKDVDEDIEKIVCKYGLKWKDIFVVWRNYHYLHSLGRIKNNSEKYAQISKLTGISISDLEEIGRLLLESHIIEEETKTTLLYLKNKGYKLGIISNNINEDVKYILKRDKIENLFEVVVCSSLVGERKPSANIFFKAFEGILKEDYSNILFVSDELAEDIVGAKALGTKNAWVCKQTVNFWKSKEPEIFEVDFKINEIKDLRNIL